MEPNAENSCCRDEIKEKLRQNFDGKIVRKDLTKKIKEGANVPVYVLEFLLGQYCSSDDEAIIEKGVQNVKHILADNFVRPDEAQKILSQLRKKGSHTVIDMITVNLDIKKNCFFASFSNLGLDKVPISDEYPEKYDRLLCGGIWCIVQLDYEVEGDNNFGLVDLGGEPLQSSQKKQKDLTPISIRKLTPIQMPHIDIDELKRDRKAFTKDEWLDILLRSIGMEPDEFTEREKWLLLTRMIPLVENNFNLCELGPRSTGKSHLYKEISPNSILISGGQTTVANLFYNMGRKSVGLVGLWDCVAFDEVAGIKFKDKDGIQIMKDYMASGSFARGKEEKVASASMVFVGNINQSVDILLKTSSLFDPFPPEMGTDTAFLDRIHCYLPGWEIPKFRPEHFTNDYGFISDYLAEFIRELRKEQYGDALDHYFRLGKNLNQRDTIVPLGQYTIPVITLDKDTPKEAVCQVFENVNTGGVSLTVFELVTAIFAMDNFELRKDWEERKNKYFNDEILSVTSATDFLTACTLLSSYKKGGTVSCKKKDVLNLTLAEYQRYADDLTDGFVEAEKILQEERIFSSKDLPYTTQLIPLAVLCTLLAEHNRIKTTSVKDKIKQWYWCGVFGEMYGSANETRYVYDVVGVMAWLEDASKTPKTVQEFYFNPVRLLSLQSRLSAAYKGIMARILKNQCKDFISGREMDFTVYKAESIDIHHIFPRDYCEKKGLPRAKWNSVVNKTPITYSTNREIGGVAPSQYLTKIEKKGQVSPSVLDGYLRTHLIDTGDIRADRFDDFFIKRSTAILNEIEKATGKTVSGRDSDLVIQDFGGALL